MAITYVKGKSGPWDFRQADHGSFTPEQIIAIDSIMAAYCYIDRAGYTFEHYDNDVTHTAGYFIKKWHQASPMRGVQTFEDFLLMIEASFIGFALWDTKALPQTRRRRRKQPAERDFVTACKWCDRDVSSIIVPGLVDQLKHAQTEHSNEVEVLREARRKEVLHNRDYYRRQGTLARRIGEGQYRREYSN